ncbi:MAG TPA: hypothetical protein PKL92_06605 [Aquaticitalea sp.]|nr:hypothetical protein [Aquaticitalea sp.]HNU58494.1 hypothetical protein [Aquaticitalea sp.]
MLTKVTYKIFSVAMALLVLFSTTSFKVDKHFCGGILIDTAVFSQAQKCETETFGTADGTTVKKDCCKDISEIIKGQDQLKLTKFEDLQLGQQFIVASFEYTFSNLFENLNRQIVPHNDYSPPNLVKDIHVLDRVFII